jgi:anti-anti-sigma factor
MAFSISSEITTLDGTDYRIGKITLAGELDANVAAQFRDEIERLSTQKPGRLVLIMSDLDYMASAGLRALVFARQKMGSGVDIYTVGVHDAVLETIEMTGFHHSVIMLPDYDTSVIEAI